MSMYSLLEYSSNCSNTTISLWFYSEDEATNFDANIKDKESCKFFNYKVKLLGNTRK